jgi:hypothetical protein
VQQVARDPRERLLITPASRVVQPQ